MGKLDQSPHHSSPITTATNQEPGIFTSESDGRGTPPIATGVGASVPLGQQARSKQTPDAHMNHSPNPCKGFQARNTRMVQHGARLAIKLYPVTGKAMRYGDLTFRYPCSFRFPLLAGGTLKFATFNIPPPLEKQKPHQVALSIMNTDNASKYGQPDEATHNTHPVYHFYQLLQQHPPPTQRPEPLSTRRLLALAEIIATSRKPSPNAHAHTPFASTIPNRYDRYLQRDFNSHNAFEYLCRQTLHYCPRTSPTASPSTAQQSLAQANPSPAPTGNPTPPTRLLCVDCVGHNRS
jgi:hypothetical protein